MVTNYEDLLQARVALLERVLRETTAEAREYATIAKPPVRGRVVRVVQQADAAMNATDADLTAQLRQVCEALRDIRAHAILGMNWSDEVRELFLRRAGKALASPLAQGVLGGKA